MNYQHFVPSKTFSSLYVRLTIFQAQGFNRFTSDLLPRLVLQPDCVNL